MENTLTGFEFHADGTIAENPIGLKVAMPYQDRDLLGDVVGFHTGRNILTGLTDTWLKIRHFNGEVWPLQPQAKSVKVVR